MSTSRVLVVGDDTDGRALAELLSLHGYEVAQTAQAHAAGAARAWIPDVVVADAALPELEGRLLVQALAGSHPRVLLISPRPTRALEPLGVTCVAKPIDLDGLLRWLGPELAA